MWLRSRALACWFNPSWKEKEIKPAEMAILSPYNLLFFLWTMLVGRNRKSLYKILQALGSKTGESNIAFAYDLHTPQIFLHWAQRAFWGHLLPDSGFGLGWMLYLPVPSSQSVT